MRPFQALPVIFLFPVCVFSQAWLSPKGEGTVSLLYQYGVDRYHTFSNSLAADRGHIFLQGLITDVDYSLTERLAVRVSMPYIQSKYKGSSPHLFIRDQPETAVVLDNGTYQGGFQDFRFDVRYNISRKFFHLTPFFATLIPSHDYPTLGHAAIGTRQREYRLGVNVGRRLNPILPKAYVQGRYAFGFVQEIVNVAPKRSYVEFQFGYFLTRRLSLQGSTVWSHTHNGIDFVYGLFPNNLPEEQYLNHDRISRTGLLDLGGSAAWSINRSTSLFFGLGHSVHGTNNHLRAAVVTFGFTKGFTARHSAEKLAEGAFLPEASKALVCTCAKSK